MESIHVNVNMNIKNLRDDLLLSSERYYEALKTYDVGTNVIIEDLAVLHGIIKFLEADCYYDIIDEKCLANIERVIGDIRRNNCFLNNTVNIDTLANEKEDTGDMDDTNFGKIIYNVTQATGVYSYSASTARAAVPEDKRGAGTIIVYATTRLTWVVEQFCYTDVSDWLSGTFWQQLATVNYVDENSGDDAVWGNISGDITNQSDLTTYINNSINNTITNRNLLDINDIIAGQNVTVTRDTSAGTVTISSTGGGGGSDIHLIGTGDTTQPTNGNAYSALRSRNEFLNANEDDTAEGKITFLDGWQAGNDFATGWLGYGALFNKTVDDKWRLELDQLFVRGQAEFNELVINQINAVGGEILVSYASMEIIEVEDTGTTWRCFFDTIEGTRSNQFVQYDQAICQKFDGQNVKRYWRLITGVGTDFIDISKTDMEAGSSIPEVGDIVLQLGNRTDENRQSAIMISAKGADGPSIKMYDNIATYSLVNLDKVVIGKNTKITGTLLVQSDDGTAYRVPVDKGGWIASNTYYYYDRVSHNGSLYLCIAISTTVEPGTDEDIWQIQVEKGQQGTDGGDVGKWVEIQGSRLFIYDNPELSGTPNPETINLAAIIYNIDSPTYEWTNEETNEVLGTSSTLVVTPEMFNGEVNLYIRCDITEGDTASVFYDKVQLARLGNGSGAYYIDLSNSTITIPFNADGTIPLNGYGNAYTDIEVRNGTDIVPIDNIEVSVLLGTVNYNLSSDNSRLNITSLSTVEARIQLAITVEGVEITRDVIIVQSRRGEDGEDGEDGAPGNPGQDGLNAVILIVSGEQIFKYNAEGTVVTPTAITLTSILQNSGSEITYQWQWSAVGQYNYVDIAGATNSSYEVLPSFAGYNNSDSVTFRLKATYQGIDYYDEITVTKVRDGLDGSARYTGILSNESSAVPSSYTGVVTNANLGKVTTNCRMFFGADEITNFNVASQLISGTATAVRDDKKFTLASFSQSDDYVIFRINFYVNGDIVDFVDWNISKVRAAAPNDYRVDVYTVSPSQPTTPTFNIIPTSSGIVDNGFTWYVSVPSNNTTVWQSTATFSGETDTIISSSGSTWSIPARISGHDGDDGANGNYDVTIYASQASAPQRRLQSSIPDFGSSVVEQNTTWYRDPPVKTSTNKIWMCKGTISGITNALIPVNGYYWSTPTQISGEDGLSGSDSVPGITYVFRGVWTSGETYYYQQSTNNSPGRSDVVRMGTSNYTYYYRTNTTGGTNSPTTNTSYWAQFTGNFENIATGLLFAEDASIAGWQFSNNVIYSEAGNAVFDGRSTSTYRISIGSGAVNNPSGGAFRVSNSGTMIATNATISNANGNYNLSIGSGNITFRNTAINQDMLIIEQRTNNTSGGYMPRITLNDYTTLFPGAATSAPAQTIVLDTYGLQLTGHTVNGNRTNANYSNFGFDVTQVSGGTASFNVYCTNGETVIMARGIRRTPGTANQIYIDTNGYLRWA